MVEVGGLTVILQRGIDLQHCLPEWVKLLDPRAAHDEGADAFPLDENGSVIGSFGRYRCLEVDVAGGRLAWLFVLTRDAHRHEGGWSLFRHFRNHDNPDGSDKPARLIQPMLMCGEVVVPLEHLVQRGVRVPVLLHEGGGLTRPITIDEALHFLASDLCRNREGPVAAIGKAYRSVTSRSGSISNIP
jgi:hypothetical protein